MTRYVSLQRPWASRKAAECMACGGAGCGLCRGPEQAQPLYSPAVETEAPPSRDPAPHWLSCRRGEEAMLGVIVPPAGAGPRSREVALAPWSPQRRAAVLAVSSVLLAGTLWCVVGRGLSHGAPEQGSRGAAQRSLEMPPGAPGPAAGSVVDGLKAAAGSTVQNRGASNAAAGNIFDDLSREIASEGAGTGASGREGDVRHHELLHGSPSTPPPVGTRSGPRHNHSGLNQSRSRPPGYKRSGQHHNLSHNASHNLSHNASHNNNNHSHSHKHTTTKAKNITENLEKIMMAGDWELHPSKNCYFLMGSGRFPDGDEGNSNETKIDLDDCMQACAANKFCDGIVVTAGATNGWCSLRSELILTACAEDESFDTWQRGSIDGHVKRLTDSYGWSHYENKNCYAGHGTTAEHPKGISYDLYSSEDEAIPLSECMQRCQEDSFCEAIVTSHGKNVSTCRLRAWVNPDNCSYNEELDMWRMDQGRKVPHGIELPSGEPGRDRLFGVADMITQWSFKKLNFTRCALIGASGVMRGSNAGEDIDGHTAVIRLNRMPTPEFYGDFGARTDVLFLSKEWSGTVALMGGEKPETSKCGDVPGCSEAGILVRGDLERCDPGHMSYKWGQTHPMVGCTHANVSRMVATGFYTLHGLLTTAGLMAFFTFLPVCGELDLYGFGGNSTADGHSEWSGGHNLREEHFIQDKVINRQYDDLPWRNTFKEFDWIMEHAAPARKVVGTMP